MPVSKRKSLSQPGSSSKKQRVDSSITIEEDEEEDLQLVLQQIKEQEASELLARRLQEEWDQNAQAGPSTSNSIGLESDEALARRLAAEWERQDAQSDVEFVESDTKESEELDEHRHDVDTPDVQLAAFRDMFISSRPCTKCNKAVPAPRGYIIYSDDELPPTLISLMHATCTCKTIHCRGCWKPLPCRPKCDGTDEAGPCQAIYCCAESRAIGLFEALGALDHLILNEKLADGERAKVIAAKYKKPSRGSAVGPGGTGYGTGSVKSWNSTHHSKTRSKGKGKAAKNRGQSSESQSDHRICRALLTLAKLLPSPYQDEPQPYDLVPHESLGLLCSLSKLPDLLGDLLRNDSVTDWISRSQVYYATLTLLRRLCESELTIPMLIRPGWERSIKSCGLEEWMWCEGNISWERDKKGNVERIVPLYDHFNKLSKQSEAFLAGANNFVEDGGDHDEVEDTMVQGVSLCGAIIEARDTMDRAIQIVGLDKEVISKGKGKNRDPEENGANVYHAECEKISLKHVTISKKYYHYARELDQTAASTRNPTDRFHLIKELASLATALPPGIWVRIDEVRTDMIKIMIAGPENTPYEGGLYEFDCFLPLSYPHNPPLLNLCTTAGGRVRFNPNLYANGKVCLSLLGTWPGRPEEQWTSKSTILQVLLSIQSFIFVDTPFYNEPGMGIADPTSRNNIAYNEHVSLQNVRWAIVDWLSDENRNGMWADVIHMHFYLLKNKIRKRILEWASKDRRMYAYDSASASLCGTHTEATNGPGVRGSKMNLLHEFSTRVAKLPPLI